MSIVDINELCSIINIIYVVLLYCKVCLMFCQIYTHVCLCCVMWYDVVSWLLRMCGYVCVYLCVVVVSMWVL